MNMKHFTHFLSVACLALVSNWMQAQVNITSTPPPPTAPLDVCGAPAHFRVRVQGVGPSAANNGQLTIQMPTGINYKAGSATYVSGATGSIGEDLTNPSAPILSIANVVVGNTITIDFQAEADCRRINQPANSNQYILASSAGTQTFAGGTSSNPGYNVQYAAMNITSVSNSAYLGIAGGIFTRTITVINGGFGATPLLKLDAGNTGGLQIQSVTVTGASSIVSATPFPAGSSTYLVSGFTGNGLFDTNESITITETLQMPATSCGGAAGSSQSTFKAYYGCFGDPICPETNSTDISSSAVAAVSWTGGSAGGSANLTLSAPEATPTACFANAVSYSLVVTNTSATDAINALVTLDSRDKDLQYLSNFSVNGSPLTATVVTPASAGASGCFTTVPSGAFYKGRILLPTIPAGQSITILFEGQRCCNSSYCRKTGDIHYGFNASMTYSDACGHAASVANKTYGTAANADASVLTTYQEIKDLIVYVDTSATANYAVDLDFAVPQGDNTAYFEFKLPIRSDFYYDNAPVTIKQGALTWVGHTSLVDTTLVIRFDVSELPTGFSLDVRQKRRLNIPIQSDNTGICRGGWLAKVGVTYYPTASCTNCGMKLYCDGNEIKQFIFKFCILACDGRFSTLKSKLQRLSFGFPDNNHDNIPDATGTIDQTIARKYDVILGDSITVEFKMLVKDTTGLGWKYGSVFTKMENSITNMGPVSVQSNVKIASSTGNYNYSVNATVADDVPTNTRTFKYLLNSGLPASYRFRQGDTVTFTSRYRVTQQLNTAIVLISPQLLITNDSTEVITAGGDCFGKPTFVYVHPIKTIAAASVQRDPSPCATTGVVRATVFNTINNDFGGDLFDGEVRKTAYETNWSIGLPQGITIDSARVTFNGSYDNYTSGSLPILPTSVTAATANFNLKPFYKQFGGVVENWEDKNSVELKIYYKGANPACANSATSQQFISNREFLNPIKAFKPTENTVTNYTFNNASSGSTGFYMVSNDDLTSVGDTVTWLVRIANTSSGLLNNVWLAKKSGLSGVNIANVRRVDCGTNIPIGTPIQLDAKGYFKLGDVSSAGICLAVKATFTSCIKDSLTLISGFSCTGYPSSIQNLSLLCGIAEQKVYVRPAPTQLQQIITAQPSVEVDLCEIMHYQIAVNSAQKGSVNSIQTQLEILPGQGLNIKTGTSQVEYPHGSGVWTTIPDPVLIGNTYQWNISQAPSLAASIGANGLYGIDSAGVGKNRFNLRFDVTTTPCNFRSGIVFIFKTQGKRACGEIIRATDQVTLPVNINGAPTTINNYAVDIKTTSSSPCNNIGSTIHFKAINQGPAVSTANEYIDFVIFNGGAMGNIVPIRNASALGSPFVTSPPGGTVYSYTMPAGVTIGDSIVFDATIALNTPALVCGVNTVRIDASTTVRFSATCQGTGQTCTLQQTTGSDADYITINRPKIKIESLVASATLNPPTGETLVAHAVIKNYGTTPIVSANPFTVKFYHDADLSGSVSSGDLLLGSQTAAVNIAPNGTYTVDFTKDVPPGKACPILAVIEETACYCSVPATATTNVPLTPATFETTTCQGITSIPLGVNEISGYNYQWVALTPGGLQWLSSTTDANPTFTKPLGFAEDFEYVVYIDRGASSCMGEIHVTVHLASETDCPNYEGTIGNYTWIDTNGNGINDEPASAGLNGVQVQLWSSINTIVGDADDGYVSGLITANDPNGRPGYYLFSHLNNGNYFVKFAKVPAGAAGLTTATTTANTDNNSDADVTTGFSPIVPINIQAGGFLRENLTIDAGYTPGATLGDYVWIDENKDGKQDPSELPLGGVEVRLYQAAATGAGRTFLKSTFTRADGHYLFTELSTDNYYVEFVKPASFSPTPQTAGTIDGSDPDGTGFTQKIPLARAQNRLDIDAGFFNTPLPVQLVSFDGRANGCAIDLVWVTASEINNKEFVVMRSDDGTSNWKVLGTVKGFGTTSIAHTYTFTDKKARRYNFYKIVQYDFDGTNEEYSLTRNIETNGCYETLDNGFNAVYPNPNNTSLVNFKFYTQFGSEDVRVEFTNTLGQCVQMNTVHVENGANIVSLDIEKLAAGSYTLRVVGASWYSEPQKLIRLR